MGTSDGRNRDTMDSKTIVSAACNTINVDGNEKWKCVKHALLIKIAPREDPQKNSKAAMMRRIDVWSLGGPAVMATDIVPGVWAALDTCLRR